MKNSRQFILTAVPLALMALAAVVLLHLKAHQRLGDPGVKTRPMADSKNLEILMPETVPGYDSIILTNNEDVLKILPPDTSYRVRLYTATDGFAVEISTVLMGVDRTSLHSPYLCLPGQGWDIDESKTKVVNIPIARPVPYQLPANRLITDKVVDNQASKGIYLYWYVDGEEFTASAAKWKAWLMPRDILTRGVLDRWAYISCWAPCLPGQEDATYDRMTKLIAAAVPEFQLVPHAAR